MTEHVEGGIPDRRAPLVRVDDAAVTDDATGEVVVERPVARHGECSEERERQGIRGDEDDECSRIPATVANGGALACRLVLTHGATLLGSATGTACSFRSAWSNHLIPNRPSRSRRGCRREFARGGAVVRVVGGPFLASRLVIWGVALFALMALPSALRVAPAEDTPAYTHDLGWATDVWARWDSVSFLAIARHGYDGAPRRVVGRVLSALPGARRASRADPPRPLRARRRARLARGLRRGCVPPVRSRRAAGSATRSPLRAGRLPRRVPVRPLPAGGLQREACSSRSRSARSSPQSGAG